MVNVKNLNYIKNVEFACKIMIIGPNTQHTMMLEIVQVDQLYTMQVLVNNIYGGSNESLHYA